MVEVQRVHQGVPDSVVRAVEEVGMTAISGPVEEVLDLVGMAQTSGKTALARQARNHL